MPGKHRASGRLPGFRADNDPEQLYLALADSAGRVGVVIHPDGPASSQTGDWTLWAAALADFADQGVNLSGMKKMMLGLGDRVNPLAGGSGTMYFDDIAVGNPVQTVDNHRPKSLRGSFGSRQTGRSEGAPLWVRLAKLTTSRRRTKHRCLCGRRQTSQTLPEFLLALAAHSAAFCLDFSHDRIIAP